MAIVLTGSGIYCRGPNTGAVTETGMDIDSGGTPNILIVTTAAWHSGYFYLTDIELGNGTS